MFPGGRSGTVNTRERVGECCVSSATEPVSKRRTGVAGDVQVAHAVELHAVVEAGASDADGRPQDAGQQPGPSHLWRQDVGDVHRRPVRHGASLLPCFVFSSRGCGCQISNAARALNDSCGCPPLSVCCPPIRVGANLPLQTPRVFLGFKDGSFYFVCDGGAKAISSNLVVMYNAKHESSVPADPPAAAVPANLPVAVVASVPANLLAAPPAAPVAVLLPAAPVAAPVAVPVPAAPPAAPVAVPLPAAPPAAQPQAEPASQSVRGLSSLTHECELSTS